MRILPRRIATIAPVPASALVFAFAAAGAAAAPPGAQPVRHPIPPRCIWHETGFCHVAVMNCGEQGDKETGNRSGLLLFEDGKPLGPPRAVHEDIRRLGAGRYSHWTEQTLYFAASDNSDPRTNGRRYEVASSNPESALGGLSDVATPVKRRVEVIRGAHHVYAIRLGGMLDFENSHTRHNDGFAVVFQPNVSLTIANTGDCPVLWPKLVANGVRDWSTLESLLEDFTRGATDDRERALFIWQAARENRYHCSPLFPDDEFHDPVRIFNCYGLNLCDDMGYCGCSLFKHAGLGTPRQSIDPKVRSLHGHVMCEAPVNGRHQFLDIDESVFYLDRECERPVSGDECARDHDLVRREPHYGPVFTGWDASDAAAALFGSDDGAGRLFLRGHEMRYRLRPGERVVFRWDNIGKYACHSERWNQQPPFFGNSKFVYAPPIVPGRAGAPLAWTVDTPWPICGGTLRARFAGRTPGDTFAFDVRLPGRKPTRVWQGAGQGEVKADVTIDDALEPHRAPAKHRYEVVASVPVGGAELVSLEIQTDVMTAPLSLPRLRRGVNTFVYTDRQDGPHEVTVTHEWRECHALTPLSPPATLDGPPAGSIVTESIVAFRWHADPAARAYHLQVSRRADFRVPYRPAYDVIVPTNEWRVPYTGMFAPDTLYHWRVRCRDRRGIWSEWSPAQTFRWEGPRVPVDVRAESRGEDIVLRWNPNPGGVRPVHYDVYGSDEKGFSVHKTAHASHTRGTVPPNFLGRTAATEMIVVSPAPTHANMNRCYYRVVAVDARGTEGICSEFAELPHPHFWSRPPATARLAAPYTYQPGVITSLGDAQRRDLPKGDGLWDAEHLTFAVRKGPVWLQLDTPSGRLGGTPAAPGRCPVELEVRTQSGAAAVQRFDLAVE